MASKGWPHGKALSADNKSIRYFSPSALMAADPGTSEGCLRRYFYEYVKKLKAEQQTWQTTGIELHAQNEQYLLTGDRSHMGSLALSGIHMLPKPFPLDNRIMIEHEIGGSLETAPLRAAGIPVAGYIDAIHWQGTNAGTTDITDTMDPEGTIEVIDWKTTSNEKYIKTPQEMARTLQMTIYGKWALVTKQAEWVRLSHGYYITKGRHATRKVSLRVHRDQIDERWEYVEGLASSLVEVVKEDNPDRVPANTRACDAYRGCPHRSYCSAASHNSLASIFGSEFTSSLLGVEPPPVLTVENTGNQNMSLLAKLQAAAVPVTGPKPEVALEMKRLALEEVAVKYPGIGETITKLEALGIGLPVLLGEAARVYAIVKGAAPYANGELAQFEFTDPGQLAAVLAEAEGIVATRTSAPNVVAMLMPAPVVSVFPEDAPPALASPEEKVVPVITNAEEAIAVAAGEKKKAGRPKKVKDTSAPASQMTVTNTCEPPDVTYVPKMSEDGLAVMDHVASSTVTNYVAVGSSEINLYVDCIPSCKYESFWPFVNQVTVALAEKYGGDDYRTAENDKATAFGKWKGFVAAGLRGMASAGMIPPGNYLLDNAMTETGGVVVEAMREVVAQSGGLLVRGIR